MSTKKQVIENLREQRKKLEAKLDAIGKVLIDVCENYDTEACEQGVCDCDPNGWEGCLTRKIRDIVEAET